MLLKCKTVIGIFRIMQIWFLDFEIDVTIRKYTVYNCSHESVFMSFFHQSQDHCIKLFFLNSSVFQHLPVLSKERCCVLFTLLPGDSFGFDFWTARMNQSAVCCGSIPPISCEFVPVWAGLTSVFFPLSLPQSVQRMAEVLWHQLQFIQFAQYGIDAPHTWYSDFYKISTVYVFKIETLPFLSNVFVFLPS